MGPYNSYGNGGAMRAAPIGCAARAAAAALADAARGAAPTHSHPEGIKGAQAVSLAVFLARSGASKPRIRSEIATRLGYDLDRTVTAIRPEYTFDVAAERSVPEALICFLPALPGLRCAGERGTERNRRPMACRFRACGHGLGRVVAGAFPRRQPLARRTGADVEYPDRQRRAKDR